MSTLNTFLAPVAVVIVVFFSFLLLPQVSLLRFRIKNLCQAREVRCVCACVCMYILSVFLFDLCFEQIRYVF